MESKRCSFRKATISELMTTIKDLAGRGEFDRVHELIIERESNMKVEIENLRTKCESLEKAREILEFEKVGFKEKLESFEECRILKENALIRMIETQDECSEKINAKNEEISGLKKDIHKLTDQLFESNKILEIHLENLKVREVEKGLEQLKGNILLADRKSKVAEGTVNCPRTRSCSDTIDASEKEELGEKKNKNSNIQKMKMEKEPKNYASLAIGGPGRGTALKDIPNVKCKLSKMKSEDTLKLLHTILFGSTGKYKAARIKSDITRFSGLVPHDNEENQIAEVRKKLEECVKVKLAELCDVLDIPISQSNLRREDMITKLLEFLVEPHATTSELLAENEQSSNSKKRKRSSNSASDNAIPSKKKPAKKTTIMKSASKDTVGKEESKPNEEELRHATSEILKEVDFNTATFTYIKELIAKWFNMDLTAMKSTLKLIIQEELIKLVEYDDTKRNEEKPAGQA